MKAFSNSNGVPKVSIAQTTREMRIDGSECKVNHGVHNPRRGYFWNAWSRIIVVALFASSSLHGCRRESGVDEGARGLGGRARVTRMMRYKKATRRKRHQEHAKLNICKSREERVIDYVVCG